MPFVGVLLTAIVIAACSGPANEAAHQHDHPSSPDAPTAAYTTPDDSLPAVEAPAGEPAPHAHHHEDAAPLAAAEMGPILEAYFPIATMLAEDSTDGLEDASARLAAALDAAIARQPGHALLAEVREHAGRLGAASGIEPARTAFGLMGPAMARLAEVSEVPAGMTVHRMVCGMADAPEGGVWLQDHDEVRNPYFGSTMLRCARTVEAVHAEA